MKQASPILLYVTVAIALSGAIGPAVEGTDDTQMDPAALAVYMQMAKPGPEHDRLAELEGNWKQSVRMWMQPDAEPMVFEGTTSNQMVLGGRFLKSEGVSGDGPMRIETMHIIGFDRRVEHYTVTGFDTWGTYSVFARGPYHSDCRTAIMSGSDHDPIRNCRQEFEMHLRFVDENAYGWDVVYTDSARTVNGEPFKMVEITFTRDD